MPEFTCRFRVDLAPGCAIASEEATLTLSGIADAQRIELTGTRKDQPLSQSRQLILLAPSWPTREAAEAGGKRLSNMLLLALARNKVGVESWPRRPGGFVTNAGLRWLGEKFGRRTLNDSIGLTVFESDPPPVLIDPGRARPVLGTLPVRLVESFRALVPMEVELTERERVAIDLFNASFFEPAADTRLITLVMAIEALLDLECRPPESVALVDGFVAQVKGSALPEGERDSLVGSLGWLRKESIRSAGRKMVRHRLGETVYGGRAASRFFDYCYELRSELVHGGDIREARKAAVFTVGPLERLVSDLLTWPFTTQEARASAGAGHTACHVSGIGKRLWQTLCKWWSRWTS